MNRNENNLKALLDKCLTQGGMGHSELVHLMSLTRQIMEADDSAGQYKVLSMYCNWFFHSELGKNSYFDILEKSAQLIAQAILSEKTGSIPADISKLFSMDTLRHELKTLFISKNLSTLPFDYYENWHGFVIEVIGELIGKPIRFPADVGTKNRDSDLMLQRMTTLLQSKKVWIPIAISFNWEEKGEMKKAMWRIETVQKSFITGNFHLTEPRENFL